MKFLQRCLSPLRIPAATATSRRRSTGKTTDYQCLETRNMLAAFVVNTASDVVDLNDGLVSLREAITAANTNAAFGDAGAGDANGDVIRFAPALTGSTVALTGGDFSITDDLNIRGDVTISGGRLDRIFTVDSSESVRFAELTLRNGIAENGGAISFQGGGILTLFGVELTGNNTRGGATGSGSGGAVFVSGGTLRMSQSFVTDNNSAVGGGVFLEDGRANIFESRFIANRGNDGASLAVVGGELYLTGGFFVNGSALNNGGAIFLSQTTAPAVLSSVDVSGHATGNGGGLYVDDGAEVFITDDSDFARSQAASGGGIYNRGRLFVSDTNFEANSTMGDGGAIASVDATLRVVDSVFQRSIANRFGGAVYNQNSTATFLRTSFTDSRAQEPVSFGTPVSNASVSAGGALYNDQSEVFIGDSTIEDSVGQIAGGAIFGSQGRTRIFRTTISDNASTAFTNNTDIVGGGGINHSGGTLIVVDSTISNNRSLFYDGGGIATTDTVIQLINSTVSDNVARGNSGGGLAFTGESALLFNSTFTGNRAASLVGTGVGVTGGAVFAQSAGPVGTPTRLTIIGGLFEDNQASGSGGALFVDEAVLNVRPFTDGTATVFRDNRSINSVPSSTTGGAISVAVTNVNRTPTILGAEFDSNFSADGGAIHGTGTRIRVIDSLFTGNRGTDRGGAVYLNSSELIGRDNVFEGNTSPLSADIFDDSVA